MKLSSKSLDTLIKFSFNHLIIRKIGISCEVVNLSFFDSSITLFMFI